MNLNIPIIGGYMGVSTIYLNVKKYTLRKIFYSMGTFLLFPFLLLNAWRILPGHYGYHYAGLIVLCVLFHFSLEGLYSDEKISDDFVEKFHGGIILAFCFTAFFYFIALFVTNGPGFAIFPDILAWILRILLFIILVIFIFVFGFSPPRKSL